jgi:hypothetical protein
MGLDPKFVQLVEHLKEMSGTAYESIRRPNQHGIEAASMRIFEQSVKGRTSDLGTTDPMINIFFGDFIAALPRTGAIRWPASQGVDQGLKLSSTGLRASRVAFVGRMVQNPLESVRQEAARFGAIARRNFISCSSQTLMGTRLEGCCPICSTVNPAVRIDKSILQPGFMLQPPHAIDSR